MNLLKDKLYIQNFVKQVGNHCPINDNGPHLLCKMVLYFFILGLILNIINLITIIFKYSNEEKNKELLKTSLWVMVVNIILNVIWIYFIYNMCYLCRGWLAFAMYILYSVIYMFIMSYFVIIPIIDRKLEMNDINLKDKR